ncbi:MULTISPECIES: DUF1348 family protein [Paraburkholderia]|uniref:DUF1348 family protein n=1 Tax=Paraburkholderia TaxID=1822464 RepID=UPI00054E82BD|nr:MULTISPECIES: DUF1348 family protein [Paraburkholderia]MBB5447433.1 hypothetical protein [Paraburkholderia sp. WSM4177]MBB5484114.1 hypothetical protein [Paraburkholderia sp. WSM4180]MDH6146474.1 nuclear transport factor 2 (NTF2) superfamily protein [Paraburkholderia sp. WSM4179]
MSTNAEVRPPIPPFTLESAIEKVRLAEDAGNWFRSYGNEDWEFGPDGPMHHRYACINDVPIKASDRKFHSPLGRRPDDHPGLSELGL